MLDFHNLRSVSLATYTNPGPLLFFTLALPSPPAFRRASVVPPKSSSGEDLMREFTCLVLPMCNVFLTLGTNHIASSPMASYHLFPSLRLISMRP